MRAYPDRAKKLKCWDINCFGPEPRLPHTRERLPGRVLMLNSVQRLMVRCRKRMNPELWIELLMEDCGISGDAISGLHKETNELLAIFVSMSSKTKRFSKS